jgi:purine catabolism regulator
VGYPLSGTHIVMLVDIDDFRGFNRARQITEDAIQALKRDFLRRVTAVVRTGFPRALLQGRSDQVVALLPLGTEIADYQARSHSLGLQIRQAIVDWKPGFTVSVGFSGPTEAPAGVAGALREVTSVMESLARFKRWSQVVAVPELGLTGLLAAVTDERLVDYSRRHLGPLIEHDSARKGNLVTTLRAYLETGEQQQAAQRLRVHPNTLRYRLDRIREITGLELEDPETRLNLAVALRVQQLLGM